MKRGILSVILALSLVMSLSVRADAASIDGSEPSTQDVRAKITLDTSISATVNWGVMQFIYDEASTTWTADGSNSVEVQNTSARTAINATYSYTAGGTGETTIGVFTTQPDSWTMNGANNPTQEANIGVGTTYTPTDPIAVGGAQTLYLLFTTAGNLDNLTEDYSSVGTLGVTINAATNDTGAGGATDNSGD